MRADLHIAGNGCTDCLTSFCCTCCDLVQQDREAKDWQEGRGAYASMQPAPQDGMMYQRQPQVEKGMGVEGRGVAGPGGVQQQQQQGPPVYYEKR